jgi:hypothetical protein
VIELEWHPSGDGYESGPYTIEPLSGHPKHNWRLLASGSGVVGARAEPPSTHRTLRAARARARQLEWHRLRRIRLVRHLVIGGTALMALVLLFPAANDLAGFGLAMVAMAVGLRALTSALDLRLGSSWGASDDHDVDRVTPVDRVVYTTIDRLRPPADEGEPDEPAVRVLPPVSMD